MKHISRRKFLRNLGLTIGGVALGGKAGITAFGRLMNPQRTALTSGRPLKELPTVSTRRPEPGVVEAEIQAMAITTELAGFSLNAFGYGSGLPGPIPSHPDGSAMPTGCTPAQGQVPGPTLRLREGERLRLKFSNCLDQLASSHDNHYHSSGSNLHLHGPLIAPALDDPFLELAPGYSRTIELDLPTASTGTHWYHPHPHGNVTHQLSMGLAGAMIIEGGLDDELRDWEEHLLVIQDFQLNDSYQLDEVGSRGNLMVVNGQHQPVLSPETSNLRLRLVNASTARHYRLRLDHHTFYLIATDGHFLERPVTLEEIVLAPGNRADVLVELTNAAAVQLRTLDYDMPEWIPYSVHTLMSIESPEVNRSLHLPRELASVEKLDPATAVRTRRLKFSGSDRINGQRFDHNRVDFTAQLGTMEIWELENSHHPFHLHSYPVQIIDRDGVPEPFRAWRDVIEGNEGQLIRIAVPFRHYTGRTVFHCHITQHEDAGMMGIIDVLDGKG